MLLQISAFFLFSNFRKRQIALYSPCWLVGRLVGRSSPPLIFSIYSVCSLVVPTLEEAILTSVLKKNFKWPSILGQEGHSYSPKHSNLSYDQFGGGLEQSDTAPLLLPPGWRDTDSFSWICSVFNSSISRRSWNLFLCPCKWALRLKAIWLNRWTWTTKRRTRPPTRWWTTCLQAR